MLKYESSTILQRKTNTHFCFLKFLQSFYNFQNHISNWWEIGFAWIVLEEDFLEFQNLLQNLRSLCCEKLRVFICNMLQDERHLDHSQEIFPQENLKLFLDFQAYSSFQYKVSHKIQKLISLQKEVYLVFILCKLTRICLFKLW